MLLLSVSQLYLSFLHIVIGVFKVSLNIIEHLSLSLNQHGELLKEFKKFIHILLEPEDILVLILDILNCVFYFWVDANPLAHNLLL